MTTTFLLGNGFDVCLGLQTKYCQFYKDHYTLLPLDGLPPYLVEFRKEIMNYVNPNNIKKEGDIDWADLEIALGKYANRVDKAENYINIILDVNEELKSYIKKQNDSLVIGEEKANKLITDFCLPDSLQYLSPQDNSMIREYKNSFTGKETINFVTFNYTESLERIFALGDAKTPSNSAGTQTAINKIIHIHSHIIDDPAILVGVNDPSQIDNVKFRDNEDVLDVIVKPRTNSMFGNGKNAQTENLLHTTNLFVCFGVSMGETDKKWWSLIGNELLNRGSVMLLYFVYDNPAESNPLKIGSKRRSFVKKFMKAAGLSEGNLQTIRSKTVVAYNTDIFK